MYPASGEGCLGIAVVKPHKSRTYYTLSPTAAVKVFTLVEAGFEFENYERLYQ
jgi:hypothetical protein